MLPVKANVRKKIEQEGIREDEEIKIGNILRIYGNQTSLKRK